MNHTKIDLVSDVYVTTNHLKHDKKKKLMKKYRDDKNMWNSPQWEGTETYGTVGPFKGYKIAQKREPTHWLA